MAVTWAFNSAAACSAREIANWLDYYLAVLNGAGIDVQDNNEFKDFVGRLAFHPVKPLSIGVNYYNGFDRFTSSPTKDQNRIRWGGDALLDLGRFTARGEWLKAEEGNSNPIVHEGWYAQGSYFLVPKIFSSSSATILIDDES